MRRLLTSFSLLAAAIIATAPPASAAPDRCRPRSGEHTLARSHEAAVLARARPGRQTLTGCSRRTGRRRTLDVLGLQDNGSRSRLVGLRLAGTRIAYVTTVEYSDWDTVTTLIADDALHGGRQHELSWRRTAQARVTSWTVDAEGDVAWTEAGDRVAPVLWVRHAGLGIRRVDGRADLRDVRLAAGVLRWRRNGVPRSVDLATVPRSACAPRANMGTLDIDLYGDSGYATPIRVCLRATGRSAPVNQSYPTTTLVDVNGPRLVFNQVMHVTGAFMLDLTTGQTSPVGQVDGWDPDGAVDDAAITAGGSVAWTDHRGFWARDAAGARKVAELGAGPLLLDGSTVTWSGGGPAVTLNP